MNTAIDVLAQAKPYKPRCNAEDFEADKLEVLQELREAGTRGVSTLEFHQRGIGGERPPNRICDLRKDGHLIQTKREKRRQFRFVLLRENPSPTPRPSQRKAEQRTFTNSDDWYERQTGKPRPSGKPEVPSADLSLFDGAVRG